MKKLLMISLLSSSFTMAAKPPLASGTVAKVICQFSPKHVDRENLPKKLTAIIDLKKSDVAVTFDQENDGSHEYASWRLVKANKDKTFERVVKDNLDPRTFLILGSGFEDTEFTLTLAYYPYSGFGGSVDNPHNDPFVWANIVAITDQIISPASSQKCSIEILK